VRGNNDEAQEVGIRLLLPVVEEATFSFEEDKYQGVGGLDEDQGMLSPCLTVELKAPTRVVKAQNTEQTMGMVEIDFEKMCVCTADQGKEAGVTGDFCPCIGVREEIAEEGNLIYERSSHDDVKDLPPKLC